MRGVDRGRIAAAPIRPALCDEPGDRRLEQRARATRELGRDTRSRDHARKEDDHAGRAVRDPEVDLRPRGDAPGDAIAARVPSHRALDRQRGEARDDQLYEVKSSLILQPGPAALTDGLDALARIVGAVAHGEKLPAPRAGDLRRG